MKVADCAPERTRMRRRSMGGDCMVDFLLQKITLFNCQIILNMGRIITIHNFIADMNFPKETQISNYR
jgi:hypothetical protein